jgi:cardiolipin synthase A/B
MAGLQRFASQSFNIEGHRLMLHVNGCDRLAALLAMIEGATRTLKLFFYIFENDAVGRLVRDALIAAQARGVTVTLLVDGFGTQEQDASFFAALKKSGISFARFLPGWGKQYLLRNHQKMLIADETRAIIGGCNIAAIYYKDDPLGGSWHDLLLEIEGPSVANLAQYHDGLARWMEDSGYKLRDLRLLMARHSQRAGTIRWLHSGPFRRLSPLTHMLRREIETAKSVDMIQAYFAPNWGMLRKLGRLARRGQFRLITAARTDSTTTVNAARHCFARLLRRGAMIYEYLPQMLHMKLMIADNAVYIGSANFDMRSLYLNGELMLRIEDAGFAAAMRAFVDDNASASLAITKDVHKARSTLFNRARWTLAYFIVAILDYRVTRNVSVNSMK